MAKRIKDTTQHTIDRVMRKLRFDISSTRGPDHYETRSLARRLVALKRDSEVYKALRYEGDGVRFLLLGPLVDERDCKY